MSAGDINFNTSRRSLVLNSSEAPGQIDKTSLLRLTGTYYEEEVFARERLPASGGQCSPAGVRYHQVTRNLHLALGSVMSPAQI